MTDRVVIGTIEMTWDAAARLAVIRFDRDTAATGQDAAALVEALGRWIGSEARPFGLLGDGGRLRSVDAQYRSTWGAFLRQNRAAARVAFFNMGPVIRIAAEMFRLGTGLRLKAFAGEAEARAWLREEGVAA